MKVLNIVGEYAEAKIFTTEEHPIEEYAGKQIELLCNHPAFAGSKIRIMPDVHPGVVGTIGFTATLGPLVLPSVIGNDIGCGMTLAKVKTKGMEFQKLDAVIRDNVPSGFSVRNEPHHRAEEFDLSRMRCAEHVSKGKGMCSLGTLGGGNHFIEVDRDEEKNMYVLIHTGSRRLGKEVTDHYLRAGQEVLKSQGKDVPYEVTYLTGHLMENYLHDLAVVQEFASLNREIILAEIAKGMKWKVRETTDCIHNYVDFSSDVPMIRKGSISAKEGEPVIIPINMRDGVILGIGRGNEDWNCSAPHGAGRILKREDVKKNHTVSAFKKEMEGIYSPSINAGTLDEAPFAYRRMDEIRDAIAETVNVTKILRPIYNFKAGEE